MSSLHQLDHSLASQLVERLRPLGQEGAKRAIRVILARHTTIELAALALRWSFWARSKQQAPAGNWQTWGFLSGRGFGKTLAISKWINGEVDEGRAPLIALAAQDEANCIDLQINGPSGLIATAPPWNRPELASSPSPHLVWPNGAVAYVRTPEVPGKIRGLEYRLSWICELQSWPKATQQEALDNFYLSTRLGYSRIVWDATAKKGHPLLKQLVKSAADDPELHRIVRGTMYENPSLSTAYRAAMDKKFAGTRRGREELLGEMPDDDEDGTVKQKWIDDTRRDRPSKFARRVVSIDPAVTDKKGSDTTGIVEAALGFDEQEYVLGDDSGKMDVGKWADLALDRYVDGNCSLILAETNKGGRLVVQNLRATAKMRKPPLTVVVVAKDEKPQPVRGTVFVKEVFARGNKAERAEPVGTAYQRGRISHVTDANLSSLEETLTTWQPAPGQDSPGDLDALVHASVELLGLNDDTPDKKKGFAGLETAGKQLLQPQSSANVLAALLAPATGGNDRI